MPPIDLVSYVVSISGGSGRSSTSIRSETVNPPGTDGGIVSAATNSTTAGSLTLPTSSTSTRLRTTLSP